MLSSVKDNKSRPCICLRKAQGRLYRRYKFKKIDISLSSLSRKRRLPAFRRNNRTWGKPYEKPLIRGTADIPKD